VSALPEASGRARRWPRDFVFMRFPAGGHHCGRGVRSAPGLDSRSSAIHPDHPPMQA